MATYTIELRTLIENGVEIFDFNYPFYDESKRHDFEQDFIRHFYFREIGQETIDKFKYYLEDKFKTVFPYYNKLLEASEVEYNLLDHYRLEETMERDIVNDSEVKNKLSSVGRVYDEQETETKQDRKTGVTGTESENNSGTSNTETENTVESNVEGMNGQQTTKKYIDTPQGLSNLSDSKYLTNMSHDDVQGATEETTNTTNNTSVNGENTEQKSKDFQNEETTLDTTVTTITDEQKNTQDSNSNSQATGTQKEVYKMVRSGNIGVATDAEGIEKHAILRKTLDNLKRMFFDECEDLFLMVF